MKAVVHCCAVTLQVPQHAIPSASNGSWQVKEQCSVVVVGSDVADTGINFKGEVLAGSPAACGHEDPQHLQYMYVLD